jgi:hypothetical protein
MLVGLSLYPVGATSGLPSSAEFGYGARLNLWGSNIKGAIKTSAKLGFEWIAIDYDWASMWPQINSDPNWQMLDLVMAEARRNRVLILLSVTNAPGWALSSKGPNKEWTSQLIQGLIQRYPKTLLALELFPNANTKTGWGAIPNPKNYAELLKTVHDSILEVSNNVHLVAGGLTPLLAIDNPEEIDDISFLKELYSAGASTYMPIISLRLPNVEGKPYDHPGKTNYPVLRHYEEVREVMLNFDHRDGLIWITEFTWPHSSSMALSTTDIKDQTHFLTEAYALLRAQLYVGAAFFEPLNPSNPSNQSDYHQYSLVFDDSTPNPAFEILSQGIKRRFKSEFMHGDQFRKSMRKSFSKMVMPEG